MPLIRNISFAGNFNPQTSVLSEGKPIDQEGQKDLLGDTFPDFNVDDMVLERRMGFNNGNMNFLGIALAFGAVGMASFITASPVEGSAGIP